MGMYSYGDTAAYTDVTRAMSESYQKACNAMAAQQQYSVSTPDYYTGTAYAEPTKLEYYRIGNTTYLVDKLKREAICAKCNHVDKYIVKDLYGFFV